MTLKEKFDLFYANMVNQKSEVSDATNIYQCMDLAYQWTFSLDIPKATIQHLYAYQAYTQPSDLTRQYFDIIPNSATFVPQAGDLVVFSNRNLNGTYFNTAGHIAIANGSGDIYRFKSFDQNWGGQIGLTLIEHNYNNPKLLGVLRPKYSSATTDIRLTLLNEAGITDEGKTRLAIDRNRNYPQLEVDKANLQNSYNDLQNNYNSLKSRIKQAVNSAIDTTA